MDLCDWDQMKAEQITELYQRKIARGESLTVARIEVKEGAITHPHSHAHEEMILVLTGSWRFYLPSGEVTVKADQMLCIPEGVEHSSLALEDTVAIDICAATRADWLSGADQSLHHDPDQSLWGV